MKSPEGPSRRDFREDVQREQNRIDELDGSVDSTVRDFENEQKTQAMTEAYVDRVNVLQGRISEMRRRIEVQKNMRSNDWQRLETFCTNTERGLYEMLKSVDYENVDTMAMAVNFRVGLYITNLENIDGRVNEQSENVEDRVGSFALLERWDVPVENDAQRGQIGAEIYQKYGPEALQIVEANLALFEGLSPTIRQKLFGITAVDRRQVVGQMLAMNPAQFGESPNGFVLGDVEKEVNGLRERTLDALSDLQKEYDKIQTAKSNDEQSLIKRIKNEDEEGQDAALSVIADFEKQAAEMQRRMMPLRQLLAGIDVALVSFDVAEDRLRGREEEADRTVLTAYEQYGESLRDMPGIGDQIDESMSRLGNEGKLTDVDRALVGKDPRQAIESAVEQNRRIGELTDIADQLQTKETFNVTNVRKGSDLFRYRPVKYDGRNQDWLLQRDVVTLNFQDGRSMNLFASRSAVDAFDRVPDGCQPVILKRVRSISYTSSAGSGRYKTGKGSFLKYSPGDSNIEARDVGYIDENGTIYQDRAGPIDTSGDDPSKDLEFIDEQINKQRSFRATTYRHPKTLKYPSGKPFNSLLLTIETQSGEKTEGVRISTAAKAMLDNDPPKGYTLVLKRIPKPPVFSTTYSERYGSTKVPKYRRWQNVLSSDKLTTADFAYAKLEKSDGGDRRLTVMNAGGEQAADASLGELEKTRDENSRDIMRAIDKDPAIATLQKDASGIVGPLQRLQQVFQAAQGGPTRYAGVVDFARNEAQNLKTKLTDPKVKQNLYAAKARLNELKESNLGVALGGMERELDARIKQLDDFAGILENDKIVGLLNKMLDKSQFDEDTWGDIIVEGIKIIAVIAIAVGVAVATAGAGLVVMAAASTAAGIAAYELAEEAEYAAYNLFDEDVTSGRMSYKKRSRLGNYLGDGKMYDPVTGEYRDMRFIEDVANPYAKQFIIQFTIQLATMGLLKAAMPKINAMAQSSGFLNAVASRSALANRILARMSQIAGNGADDAVSSSFGRKFAAEFVDELSDEALETGAESALVRIDARLGAAATLLIGAAKGFKPRGSTSLVYDASIDAQTSNQMVIDWTAEEGHTILNQSDGVYQIRTFDGNNITVMPDNMVSTEVTTESPGSTVAETARAAATEGTVASADSPGTQSETNGVDPSQTNRTRLATGIENSSVNLSNIESEIASGNVNAIDAQAVIDNASPEAINDLFTDLADTKADRINESVEGDMDLEAKIADKLGVETLTVTQKRAILSAHLVGIENGGSVESGFSQADIAQKTRVLRGFDENGAQRPKGEETFDADQRRIIMEDLQLSGYQRQLEVAGIGVQSPDLARMEGVLENTTALEGMTYDQVVATIENTGYREAIDEEAGRMTIGAGAKTGGDMDAIVITADNKLVSIRAGTKGLYSIAIIANNVDAGDTETLRTQIETEADFTGADNFGPRVERMLGRDAPDQRVRMPTDKLNRMTVERIPIDRNDEVVVTKLDPTTLRPKTEKPFLEGKIAFKPAKGDILRTETILNDEESSFGNTSQIEEAYQDPNSNRYIIRTRSGSYYEIRKKTPRKPRSTANDANRETTELSSPNTETVADSPVRIGQKIAVFRTGRSEPEPGWTITETGTIYTVRKNGKTRYASENDIRDIRAQGYEVLERNENSVLATDDKGKTKRMSYGQVNRANPNLSL